MAWNSICYCRLINYKVRDLDLLEFIKIEESKSLKFQGWLPLSSARKLFSMSKLDFASMKKEALSPEFQPKKMDVKSINRCFGGATMD